MFASLNRSIRHALTRAGVVAVFAAATLSWAPAQAVEAAPSGESPTAARKGAVLVQPRVSRRLPVARERVVGVAAAQAGDRYVYGGSGPHAFDCSGLTSFVYRVATGRSLPHSSAAQRQVTQQIPRAAARPGDLVFFHGPSGVYHVGIFAGGNALIHASKPGVPVGRSAIWSGNVTFGRVR